MTCRRCWSGETGCTYCGELLVPKAELVEVEDALKLAQQWLVNCQPLVDFGPPYPAPAVAEALRTLERVLHPKV
jgi:hypothetical protein